MRKTEEKNTYKVQVTTKDNYKVSKEIEAHNEWEATLKFDDIINYHLDLYFNDNDYVIDFITQVH